MKPHIRIEKVNNGGTLTVYDKHNHRTNPNENLNHVDLTKTYLNHDLVNPNNIALSTLVYNRIDEVSRLTGANIRKRKDAVIGLSVLLSYTHEDYCLKTGEKQFTTEEWEQASLKWLQDTFGGSNVVSAMVHLDEASPHIHAVVVPITEDNRLCAKDFTGGRAAMVTLQRSYAKKMQEPPFNMQETRTYTKPSQATLKQFYTDVVDIENFAKEVPVKEKEEGLDDYLERVTDYCKASEIRRLAEQKHYKEKIKDLENTLHETRGADYVMNELQMFLEYSMGQAKAKQELKRLLKIEQYPRELVDQMFLQMEQIAKEQDIVAPFV